jgi:tRNA (Thr-GGU) A37 N-methylase
LHARPNPLELHPVTVREIGGTRVKIGPIEIFDGTPVVDIKSASRHLGAVSKHLLSGLSRPGASL